MPQVDTLQTLEKANRVLQKKLERSEADRRRLEEANRQREALLKQSIQELENANARLEQEMHDRQQTEQVVRQTLEILDLASDSIIIRDMDDRVIYWNQGAENLYGWRRSEVQGQYIHTILQTSFSESLETVLNQFLQQGEWQGEIFHTTCEGKRIIVSSRWTLQRDAAGNPCAQLEINHDITARKQAEEALHREQEFTRIVIESVSEGVVACDANGSLKLFNRAAQTWHGCDPREVPPEAWADLYGLYEADEITPLPTERIPLLRAFRGESVRGAEMTIVATGQPPRHVLTSGDPLFDSTGRKIGAVAIMHDVTERLQAEAELRLSIERFQFLANSVPQMIWTARPNGEIDYYNQRWYDYTGITLEQSREYGWQFGLHPDDRQRCLDRWIHSLNTGENYQVEYRFQRTSDGAYRWHLGRALAMRNEAGEIVQWIGTCTDIDDQKRAEAELWQSRAIAQEQAKQIEAAMQELTRTQAQVVQSEKMSSLGQLVAGVAHEINNPVNFISGNLTHANQYTQDLLGLLQLYQQHYADPVPEIQTTMAEIDLDFLLEDLPKLLISMQVGAERIQTIVRSLRNFSRMDEAEMKAVDIHEGIESTLMILQNCLKDKPDQPAINVVKEYGNLPPVECYAGQLNQVFMNILSNAIDALEESSVIGQTTSTITIRTSIIDSGWVQITIADNGFGIPAEVQKRLFDPFFTTKPVGKGTGLGMSISYQIVTERHGGFLRCSSQPGQGAEFTIEIPVQQHTPCIR